MKTKKTLVGLLFSVGALFSFLLVEYMINNFTLEKSKTKVVKDFNIQKIQRKITPKKEKVRKKVAKRRKRVKSLKPKLSQLLSGNGVDLGLDLVDIAARDSDLLGDGDAIMTEDSVDQKPVAGTRSPIPFPDSARDEGIDGFVKLQMLITDRGQVKKVKLLKAEPPGYFEDVAIRSVKSWSYQPAMFQGRAVNVWVTQKIDFKVN